MYHVAERLTVEGWHRLDRWPVGDGAGPGPVLVVLTRGAGADLDLALAANPDGDAFRRQLLAAYGQIVSVTAGPVDDDAVTLDPLFAGWGPEAPAGTVEVDVLAVDVPTRTDATPPAILRRRLVELRGAVRPGSSPPDGWEQRFEVGCPAAGVDLSDHGHLQLPDGSPVAGAVLALPAVTRTVAAWLWQPPGDRGGTGAEPWRDRDLLVLPGEQPAAQVGPLIEGAEHTWIVVTGRDGGRNRVWACWPRSQLAERVAQRDGATLAALADDGRYAPGLQPEEVGPYLAPQAGPPRVVLVADRPVAVVTAVDGPAPARQPGRIWLSGEPSRPAPEPGAPTRQFLRVEGPDRLTVGIEAELRILVAGEPLPPHAGAGQGAGASTLADPGPLVIQVIGRAPVEVIGATRHDVGVHAPGRRTEIRLGLRGLGPGRGGVMAQLLQSADELASVELAFEVATSGGADRVQAGEAAGQPRATPRHRHQLTVRRNLDQRGLLVLLNLVGPGGVDLAEEVQAPIGVGPAVGRVLKAIEQLWASRRRHVAVLDEDLLALGARVADTFLPPSIRAALWEARAGLDALEIVTDEPRIPWEVATLVAPSGDAHDGHLGRRVVTRRLLGVGRGAGAELVLRPGHRFVVAPDYRHGPPTLPAASGEARALRRLGAQAVTARLDEVAAVLRRGDYDLLHVVAHGQADPGSDPFDDAVLALEDSVLEDGRITAGGLASLTVAGYRVQAGRRPVVFLNACRSGVERWGPEGLVGFASAFLGAGAGVFVGSLWAIDDEPAREFAAAFYRHLVQLGDPLGVAAAEARRRVSAPWSATPLAYAVYGDPETRVVEADLAGSHR